MQKLFAVAGLFLLAAPAFGQFVFDLPPNYTQAISPFRNCVYYEDEPVTFALTTPSVTSYAVRNYYGDLVAVGSVLHQSIDLGLLPLGWHKLNLYGDTDLGPPFSRSVGSETFVCVRHSSMPDRAAKETPGAINDITSDALMRAFVGKGPYRHGVTDLSSIQAALSQVQPDIDLDTAATVLVAFPNGTLGKESVVAGIVSALKYKARVWEGRNEPEYQFGLSTGAYTKEYLAFYNAVKAADPTAQVIGPAMRSITADWEQNWLSGFLKAVKGKIDGVSIHGYCNRSIDASYPSAFSDPAMGFRAMSDLKAILSANGLAGIPIWQTEQSYAAPLYGIYAPRIQGQRTMLQRLILDANNCPAERDCMWYDRSHGFWDWPCWWENGDGSDSLQPAAPLYRVYNEEISGCQFAARLDFGPQGNMLFVGNRYTTPNGKTVLAIVGNATLNLTSPAIVVDAFGNRTGPTSAVQARDVAYVEGNPGIAPIDFGTNYCRAKGVSAPAQLINGVCETGDDYGGKTAQDKPWFSVNSSGDYNIDFTFPAAVSIGHCLVQCLPPAFGHGTLLKYDICLWTGSAWQIVASANEDPKRFDTFTPKNIAACTQDWFGDAKSVFCHSFPAITTTRARIVVHSWAGGIGAESAAIQLREVGFYR